MSLYRNDSKIEYILVNTIPDASEMLKSDLTGSSEDDVTSMIYIYLERSTGLSYVCDASDNTVIPAYDDPVKFATCIDDVLNDGSWYAVVTDAQIIYGIPETASAIYKYENGEWKSVEPVLRELIVTEGGVYTAPNAEVPPVIAIGETITFKDVFTIDDVPEEIRVNGGNGGCWIYDDAMGFTYIYKRVYVEDGTEGFVILMESQHAALVYVDPVVANSSNFGPDYPEGAGWYDSTTNTKVAAPSITIIESSSFGSGYLQLMAKCFVGTPPADGYNKVIVDISEPVIRELTVTENGVYTAPTTEIPPVIAVGETITFKDVFTIDDVPEEIHANGINGGLWIYDDAMGFVYNYKRISMEDGTEGFVILADSQYSVLVYVDPVVANSSNFGSDYPEGAGWYDSSTGAKVAAPSITIIESSSFGSGYLQLMAKCFVGTPPADGYNTITVNVPNDMVDVTELPSSNVDSTKVYRMTDTQGSVTYGITGEAASIMLYKNGTWVRLVEAPNE